MKNIKAYISIVAIMIMVACQPDAFPEIGNKLSATEGITGTWKATSVVQIDEIAKANGDAEFELDITDQFNLEKYQIGFISGATPSTSTFTVTANGAPNFVDETGTWSFDNNEFPTKVRLFASNATTPTSEFALARVPAEGFNLQIKFQRFDGDKLYMSYLYTFSKVNN